MSAIDKVSLVPRDRRGDARGSFLKVITGTEPGMTRGELEVYIVLVKPGQSRGGHYHVRASEWFTVVQGEATLHLVDVTSQQTRSLLLGGSSPTTVHVPSGVAHEFRNAPGSAADAMVVAFTDASYDPADTIPWP